VTTDERDAPAARAHTPRDGAAASPWPATPPSHAGAQLAAADQPARQFPAAQPADPLAVPWYRRPWVIRTGIALLVAFYVLGWGLSGFYTVNPTDIDVFFVPDARIALTKGFLYIYQLRVATDYPNANGPMSMAPFTLAAALAQSHGWLGDPYLRRMLIFAVFAPFPLLVGWEAIRVTDRLFATPLRGLARVAAYAIFALTPELWHSALFYGHMEQPMEVWFVLAGARLLGERRVARGGALLALALLTRSVASVACIPLTLMLLRDTLDADGFRWRRWARGGRSANLRALRRAGLTLLRYLGAFAATLLVVLGPFLLVDRQDVIFSLVTFRSALPVGGGNLWGLAQTAGWQGIAQRYDSAITLGAALLLTLLVLAARRDLTLRSPDLFGLLTLTSLCFPLLIKMFWPYYLLETYFYAAVWVLASLPTLHRIAARTGRAPEVSLAGNRTTGAPWWGAFQDASQGALILWAFAWLLPIGVIVTAMTAEYGLSSNSYGGWVAPWAEVLTLCFLLVIGVALGWLLWGKPIWRAAAWRILHEEPFDALASGPMLATLAPMSLIHYTYTEPDTPLRETSRSHDIQPTQSNPSAQPADHAPYD